MDAPKVVHAVDIASLPELVWVALTDADLTARYRDRRTVAEWERGGIWRQVRRDGTADFLGTLLEVDPPRRFVHTWARPSEAGTAERTSVVAVDIAFSGPRVRVTITHRDLPDDQVDEAARIWTGLLASLQTYLESGSSLV
ncbi:SRPBCC domain-containing protein [Nocardia sp. alder85J]|uniref:SRPBCC domain-containing protein n=1 Tax=Nocardia sp. alder85J TaxID=2862949 RepID=UPI0022523F69|nr:SRPBCC domain-containing protein [Nocardia sp. alder85J]MCX4092634.1 SRPBCC domain-containing protein [Nocardia sp. alder85J]